jgi:hypothetical protein
MVALTQDDNIILGPGPFLFVFSTSPRSLFPQFGGSLLTSSLSAFQLSAGAKKKWQSGNFVLKKVTVTRMLHTLGGCTKEGDS